MEKTAWKPALCGALAGTVNGLFGAGGGLLLIPLLRRAGLVRDRALYASALAVMLPVSAVSFAVYALRGDVAMETALPCCLGGVAGGILGAWLYPRVPLRLLTALFGLLLVYGGVRMLL